jgi:UDP-2,3-diacylglucosamine hydrolase
MSHNIELKEGAFVISDAHYSHLRPELLYFIKEIHSKKLQPTQLIFMGDIFDALFGEVQYTHKINSEIISLINDISEEIEVIYLEGNHDFNLQKVFPNVKVFSFKMQPVLCSYEGKKVYLAHGDFDGVFTYQFYTSIIRNRFVLSFLKLIDNLSNHLILKKLDKYLSKKDDCKDFTGFEEFVKSRLSKYECVYFIEGHFHQNRSFSLEKFQYINLGAFACNQRYFIVKSLQDKELIKEEKFSKGM